MDRVRGSEDQPYIWKVPPGIRDHDKEAYEPKLISIGPLHHGREISLPMDELKLMYLRDLLGRSRKRQISSYIRVIRDIELRARKQYSESLRSLCTDAFVMMLVVDGCFIIECFLKKFFSKRQEATQMASSTVRWRLSHLRRDLMLFENQIPFFVLVALFNECSIPLITGRHHGSITLIEIVLEFLKIKLPRDKYPEAHQVHHLLHLHHLCLDPSLSLDASRSGCPYRRLILNRLEDAAIMISLILLSLPFLLLIRKPPWSWFPNGQAETPRMIPCATELEKAGVRFQKKVFKEGELNCYLKVLFVDGILEIPFLPVNESTGSELRNFIALEQCCPELGNHFTSYAVLMDNIINTEMDVTLLRNHRIIEKRLGSDAQVADMFNKLCKGTYLSYKGHYNEQLYKEVNAYCDVPHHKWRASLMGSYFGNPWSIISLVAGIFLSALVDTKNLLCQFPIPRNPLP
ncbi:hypothetical protein Taro_048213 [Colocasia esculenta]|uniref:Uncharacterized protein n=1 Tax=Colocasia esculenta TaxID=4460 RepID=A0A843WXU3_COLES|nr:hypothetical protein [Colocasia esculenta]